MAKRIVVPLNFGRKDKIAPKHAPHGVLAVVKNLRHREVGGLGKRHGYNQLSMATRNGASALKVYDLFEFGGRLCALGSDQNDGFPSELFEFTGLASEPWRASSAQRFVSINPFANLQEIAGVPQPEGGVQHVDSACGGGFACVVYRSGQTGITTACIVDAATNQTIHIEQLTAAMGASNVTFERVAFQGGSFYVVASRNNDNAIRIVKFTPGTSTSWQFFITVDAGVGNLVATLDIVPVNNSLGTNILAVGWDRVTATNAVVRTITAAGALGTTNITIAGTSTQDLWLDADETEGNILLFSIEGINTAQLRTFSFASALLAGPTTTLSGVSGSMTRLARAGADAVAVAVNNASGDVNVQTFNAATHAAENSFTIGRFIIKTRMLDGGRASTGAVVFGGLVTGDNPSNGLFYANATVAHLTVRDFLTAVSGDEGTLTRDATTGRICWSNTHNPGGLGISFTSIPAVTMLDFQSTKRIQSARYGGLRYFAGATPWVYDGRIVTESGFNEAPFISGIVSSAAGGNLTGGATYTYTAHWEYTLSDGSLISSPPALTKNITLAAGDNRATITVGTPHSLRMALGASAYAVACTLVISRTEWSPNTINLSTGLPGAQFSQLRRALQKDLVGGMATYGQLVVIVENNSDVFLSTQDVIYTQGPRGELSGPLEHDGPESCSYIAASESRLINGGLVRPFEFQISKEAFIGEPFEYSTLAAAGSAAFYGIVSGPVIGVHALMTQRIIFTTDEILRLEPGAPDDQGAGSPLGMPIRVPSPSGLKDWRSLLEGPDGLWFQLDDDKLFRMPLAVSIGTTGAPTWEGADIVDLLFQFPVITAAARHRQDNVGLFALNAANLQNAVLAVRDFFFEDWFVDTAPLTASSGIESLCVFGRTAAYTSGNVVYAQAISGGSLFSDGGAYITSLIQTDPIFSFGIGGYGLHHDLLASVEYRGDCVLNARVSLDGGITFTTLQSFNVTGFTVGQQLQYKWALPNNNTSSIVVELSDTTLGAPTEGLVYNEIDLLVEETDGALPELDPAFMA